MIDELLPYNVFVKRALNHIISLLEQKSTVFKPNGQVEELPRIVNIEPIKVKKRGRPKRRV